MTSPRDPNLTPPETPDCITSDRIRSKSLRSLIDYWVMKSRQLARMPGRADLKPEEMVPFLPFVTLITVRNEAPRFEFRLVGTAIRSAFGREATKRAVDSALFGNNAAEVEQFFSIPLATRGAAYAAGEYTVAPSGRMLGFETVLLPLSSDGETIDMLLGGLTGERIQSDEQAIGFQYRFYCPLKQTAAG